MLKSIEEEWLGFAEMVIPNLTQQHVQYKEMRKAFSARRCKRLLLIVRVAEEKL